MEPCERKSNGPRPCQFSKSRTYEQVALYGQVTFANIIQGQYLEKSVCVCVIPLDYPGRPSPKHKGKSLTIVRKRKQGRGSEKCDTVDFENGISSYVQRNAGCLQRNKERNKERTKILS